MCERVFFEQWGHNLRYMQSISENCKTQKTLLKDIIKVREKLYLLLLLLHNFFLSVFPVGANLQGQVYYTAASSGQCIFGVCIDREYKYSKGQKRVLCDRQSSISNNCAQQWLLLQCCNFRGLQMHDIETFKTNTNRKLFTQRQNYCNSF